MLRQALQTRGVIFIVQLVYLAALLSTAALYIEGTFFVPSKLGTLPLPVPWFGALGAVIISLTGTVEHRRTWDPSFAYWHLSRPLVGASVAVVSVLILQAGILAVGTTPASSGTGAPKNVLYYVVAFAVGYRESAFRQLLKSLVDAILKPGTAPGAQTAAGGQTLLALSPAFGPVAGGTSVGISGTGLTSTSQVKFGAQAAPSFTVDSDIHISTVTPPALAAGAVVVTVTTKQGPLSAHFTYH